MPELFLKIVNMSIAANWLILVIMVLRLFLKKFPRCARMLLWCMAGVRLLNPFYMESPLSLIPSAETISPEIMMEARPTIYTGISFLDSVVNPVITQTFAPKPAVSANPLQILISVSAVIWMIGMVLVGISAVVRWYILLRKEHSVSCVQPDKPNGYTSWWMLPAFLLCVIHWFNPLVWLAYVFFCRDAKPVSNEREKPAFWISAAAIAVCVIMAVCFLTVPPKQRDSMEWAQSLQAEDVLSAELVVFPQALDKQFKRLSVEELLSMAALINQSKGRYQAEYEELAGGCIFFYLTMQDGTTHSVGKVGNTYLVIDDDYYKAGYDWLSTWDNEFGEGNSSLPEGYFAYKSAWEWFDYLKNPNEMDWSGCLETENPRIPDVVFRWQSDRMEAVSKNEVEVLFEGMPIWNAFFYDLTGDGIPELCATLSIGSGVIDTRVILYDYANGVSYALADRGEYDYSLSMEKGRLMVTKREYISEEVVETGWLVFEEDTIQIVEP